MKCVERLYTPTDEFRKVQSGPGYSLSCNLISRPPV